MRHATPRHRRALALFAVAVLGIPGISGVAGAQPSDDPSDLAVPVEDRIVPFPAVDGVDLEALGYAGDPLDATALERIGAPLPDDPRDRVAEIFQRLEVAPAQHEGLVEAESLLTGALAELDPAVGRLRSAAAVAEQREDEATGRVTDARARLRQRKTDLAEHRDQMAQVAVEAYMSPPGADALSAVLGGAVATSEDLAAGVLFSAKADHDGLVKDDIELSLAVAGERLAQTTELAEQAAARTAAAEAALADLEARREAHRVALRAVEFARQRLDEQLPTLQADLDETIEETWGIIEDLAGIDVTGDLPIVSVGGIRVHAAIAPKLQAMLVHAHADGIELAGWGYRSTEQQIMLRRAHCGPTPEDVYLKPAAACSPPTAQPGQSLHERGLAIDFHLAGRAISTRQSPAFEWLAANAAQYGFHNLPSEPWHWSVNGQ